MNDWAVSDSEDDEPSMTEARVPPPPRPLPKKTPTETLITWLDREYNFEDMLVDETPGPPAPVVTPKKPRPVKRPASTLKQQTLSFAPDSKRHENWLDGMRQNLPRIITAIDESVGVGSSEHFPGWIHDSWATILGVLLEEPTQLAFWNKLVAGGVPESALWWLGVPTSKFTALFMTPGEWTLAEKKLVVAGVLRMKGVGGMTTLGDRMTILETTGVVFMETYSLIGKFKCASGWDAFWKQLHGACLDRGVNLHMCFCGKRGLKKKNVHYLPMLTTLNIYNIEKLPIVW
ncbi:ORF48 [Silurid herpesvirus 1]|nr:ORF48 [Silurid herpesvirus 1]